MSYVRAERGVLPILIACGRAWFVATCFVSLAAAAYFAKISSNVGIVSAIQAAAMIATGVFFGSFLVSFPFIFVLAAPTAFLVGQFFGRHLWLNSLIGAAIGAISGLVLVRLQILPELYCMAVFGAIYGACTGFFVTRIIHA